jgi:hypothetical protein
MKRSGQVKPSNFMPERRRTVNEPGAQQAYRSTAGDEDSLVSHARSLANRLANGELVMARISLGAFLTGLARKAKKTAP